MFGELRRLEAKLAAVAETAAALDLLFAQPQLPRANLSPQAPGRGLATGGAGEAAEAGGAASGDTARPTLPVRVGWAGLQQAGDVEAEVAASAVRIRSCPRCCPASACRRCAVACVAPLLPDVCVRGERKTGQNRVHRLLPSGIRSIPDTLKQGASIPKLNYHTTATKLPLHPEAGSEHLESWVRHSGGARSWRTRSGRAICPLTRPFRRLCASRLPLPRAVVCVSTPRPPGVRGSACHRLQRHDVRRDLEPCRVSCRAPCRA